MTVSTLEHRWQDLRAVGIRLLRIDLLPRGLGAGDAEAFSQGHSRDMLVRPCPAWIRRTGAGPLLHVAVRAAARADLCASRDRTSPCRAGPLLDAARHRAGARRLRHPATTCPAFARGRVGGLRTALRFAALRAATQGEREQVWQRWDRRASVRRRRLPARKRIRQRGRSG